MEGSVRLKDKIVALSRKIPLIKSDIVGEEDTNDVGNKKGEKIDYAILSLERRPVILLEVKHHNVPLKDYIWQIESYFSSTRVGSKFGVLTNGREY